MDMQTARVTANRFNVDTAWFRQQLERLGMSSNAMADKMGQARSEISRKLNGQRKFHYDDCVKMAKLLDQPLGAVLLRANVQVDAAPPPPTVGALNHDGELIAREGEKPRLRDLMTLEIPIQGTDAKSRLTFLVAQATEQELRHSRPGLVVLPDGRALVRVIRPGSKAGKYDLLPLFGMGQRQDDIAIDRVHWIAPNLLS